MKIFRKWELTMEETIRRGEVYIATVVVMDAIAMIFAVGVCTILGSIVEFLIGTPNWPEMVLAWLLVYGVSFHAVTESMAAIFALEELKDIEETDYAESIKYAERRFEEEM